MTTRVPIRPEMLRWACERARLEPDALAHRIPQLPAWERGEKQPTLKQLEAFARATHTPVGFLFLPEPLPGTTPSTPRTAPGWVGKRIALDKRSTIWQSGP